MCNYGKEFVRRLELKWVDLVHLMLYNLTVYNAKKYYDLDTVIVPYANDNWNTLQLPPRVSSTLAPNSRFFSKNLSNVMSFLSYRSVT